MLTGKELGAAIESARIAKGVSKKKLADHFGVAPPSIQGWVNNGRIDKAKLVAVINYFADVVPPEHWGLTEKMHDYLTGGINQNALDDNLAEEARGLALAASPRSRSALERIADAADSGMLSEEDVLLLEAIANRLSVTVSKKTDSPHQRLRKKLANNDPISE